MIKTPRIMKIIELHENSLCNMHVHGMAKHTTKAEKKEKKRAEKDIRNIYGYSF